MKEFLSVLLMVKLKNQLLLLKNALTVQFRQQKNGIKLVDPLLLLLQKILQLIGPKL